MAIKAAFRVAVTDHFSPLVEALAAAAKTTGLRLDSDVPPMPHLPCMPIVHSRAAGAEVVVVLQPTDEYLGWHRDVMRVLDWEPQS